MLGITSVAQEAYELERSATNNVSARLAHGSARSPRRADCSAFTFCTDLRQHCSQAPRRSVQVLSALVPSADHHFFFPRNCRAPTSAAPQASEIELLERQRVLLERVLALQIALDAPEVVNDKQGAIGAVQGRLDLLLPSLHHAELPATPTAASGSSFGEHDGAETSKRPSTELPGGAAVTPSHASMSSVHSFASGTSSAIDVAAAEAAAQPLPPRIAVAASDDAAGRMVVNALRFKRGSSTGCVGHGGSYAALEIVQCSTLQEAAATDCAVVVVCASPGMALHHPSDPAKSLSAILSPPDGERRGVVIVGDVDAEVQEAVFEQFCGWCELVRRPLIASELVRRIIAVHAFVRDAVRR